MQTEYRWIVAMLLVGLLALSGCGKKDGTNKGAGPAVVSDEEIAAVRNAMAKGMQPVAFVRLKSSDAGRQCLVEARTPEGGVRIPPPPPPLGMVQTVGQVTFYRGELDSISPDGLTVRKAYPTSGNAKKLEIPKADIQSIHLAP